MFGTRKCGRLGYVVIILAVLAFDLAKTPIENFLTRVHDQAMQPAGGDTQGKTAGELREMGYIVTKPGETVIFNNGRLQTFEPKRVTRTDGNREVHVTISDGAENGIANVAALMVRQTLGTGAYVAAIGAIGMASLVVLAWAVFARLRDIGWSHFVGLGLIGLLVVKLWATPHVPVIAVTGLHYAFFAGVIALAFFPGGFATGGPARRIAATTPVRATAPDRQHGPLFGKNARPRIQR